MKKSVLDIIVALGSAGQTMPIADLEQLVDFYTDAIELAKNTADTFVNELSNQKEAVVFLKKFKPEAL